MALRTFGLDPITASLIATAGQSIISGLFQPAGPSAAELAAIAAAERRRAASAASSRAWIIGGALVAGAALVALLTTRK